MWTSWNIPTPQPHNTQEVKCWIIGLPSAVKKSILWESPQAAISKKHPSPGFLEAQLFVFFVFFCAVVYLSLESLTRDEVWGELLRFSKRSGVHFWRMKIMMTSPLYRFVWTSWSLISESFDDQVTLRRHVGNYIRNTTNMEVEYGCVWKLLFFVWVHQVDATHNVHLLTQFPTKRPKNPNRRKGINDQCQKNML